MDWITASIGMTSSVSQPSSYVVVEPITASVATVVGSLSEAPATMPEPNFAPSEGCSSARCRARTVVPFSFASPRAFYPHGGSLDSARRWTTARSETAAG